MADGSERPIEAIRPGDLVLAFDGAAEGGREILVPRRVTRLFQNVTEEWFTVTASDGQVFTATPGHLFLASDGSFRRLDEIINLDGVLVRYDGALVSVVAERIKYGASTAHLYEETKALSYSLDGAAALKPQIERGWRTYNFEVEGLHTYVAAGFRVHNESWPALVVARDQFMTNFGREFTGTAADVDALMGGIANGTIKAYGEYVGALHDDRYATVAYDAIRSKVEESQTVLEAADTISIQVTGNRLTSYNVRDGYVDWKTLGLEDGSQKAGTYFEGGAYRTDILNADGSVDVSSFHKPNGAVDFVLDFENGEVKSITRASGSIDYSNVGLVFGTQLGKLIAGDNIFVDIAASTVLGALGKNIVQLIQNATDLAPHGDMSLLENLGDGTTSTLELATDLAFNDFGIDLRDAFAGQVTSLLSSFLMAELAEALDLDGVGAGVFTTAGNVVTNQFLTNVAAMADLITVSPEYAQALAADGVFAGFNAANLMTQVGSAFAAQFGSMLADSMIRAETPEAALFATAASAIGSAIGSAIFSTIPVVGPFIGAFLGRLIGTWAGNAIYDDDALAGATVGYDAVADAFRVIDARVWDGGDLNLAYSLADNVITTLHSVLATTGASVNESVLPGTHEVGYYTNYRGQQWVFADGYQDYYASQYGTRPDVLNAAAIYAVERFLSETSLTGGDPMLVRAFEHSKNSGLAQLGLDLQVAEDYKEYLANVSVINALIAADPTSEFSASWIVTLQRAHELGLDRPFYASGVDSSGNLWSTTTLNGRLTARQYTDGGAAEAWATIADRFDRYGELIGQRTTNDNGSAVDAVFDPWNQFSYTSYFDTFDASGQWLTRRTNWDNGGYQNRTFDPHNRSTWKEIIDEYDAAGRWLHRRQNNDDGTAFDQTHDVYGRNPWLKRTDTLDASGRLTARRDDNRDGTAFSHTYDVQNASAWREKQYTYDSSSRLIAYKEIQDNGSWRHDTHDAANAYAWRKVESWYSVDGKLTKKSVFSDDNSYTVQVFDTTNQNSWTWYTDIYTTDNLREIRQQKEDSGNYRVFTYDVRIQHAWREVQTVYNSANVLLSTRTTFDDSTYSVATTDPLNTATWRLLTDTFTSAGVLMSRLTKKDDNTSTRQTFDHAKNQTWREIVDQLDTQDRHLTKTQFNDDGSSVIWTYDHDQTKSWKEVIDTFDAQKRLVSQRTNHDNGTATLVEWDVLNTFDWKKRTTELNQEERKTLVRYDMDDGSLRQVSASSVDKVNAAGAVNAVYFYDADAILMRVHRLDAAQRTDTIEFYDTAGRLDRRQDFNDAQALVRDTTYSDAGLVTSITDWDAASAANWTSKVQTFDTLKRLTTLTTRFDAGNSTIETFDAAASQTWSKITESFDALGRRTERRTLDDGGTQTVLTFDAAGTATWTMLTSYYTAAGAMRQRNYDWDDGTYQTVRYDVDSTQTWSSISEKYNAARSKLYTSVYADSGTQQITHYDATGAANWTTRVVDYDASKATVKDTYNYDNGTHRQTLWDRANQADWADRTTNYDANWKPLDQRINLDTGAWTTNVWDQVNQYDWTSKTANYDTAGKLTTETGRFDNGSSWRTFYDPYSTKYWITYTEHLDSNGKLTKQTGDYDNGSHWSHQYDVNNLNAWSRILTDFDASWRKTLESGYYDNGTWFQTQWDTTGTRNWAVQTTHYDALNRYTSQTTDFDNKTKLIQVWDAAGAQNWSTYRDNYDTTGARISQIGDYDDGTHWAYQFDPHGLYYYRSYTNYYNSSWQVTTQTGQYDDGNWWSIGYDPGGQYNWSQVVYYMDSAMRQTSQHGTYDDGSGWSYYWDVTNSTNYTHFLDMKDTAGRLTNRYTYLDSGGRIEENWDPANVWWWQYSHWNYDANGILIYAYSIDDAGNYYRSWGPVGLDLDGKGLDIRPLDKGKGPFDWDGDGIADQTDWVGHRDGLLAIDVGGDGVIDQRKELAFTDWAPNTKGDMEALRAAFDSNKDGVLSDEDERWAEFHVWQDRNQNGRTDKGELKHLDDWGITSIDLMPTPTSPDDPLSRIITGTSSFTWSDGKKGIAGDLRLEYTPSSTGNFVPPSDPDLGSSLSSGSLTELEQTDAFVFRSDLVADLEPIDVQEIIKDFAAGSGTDHVAGGEPDGSYQAHLDFVITDDDLEIRIEQQMLSAAVVDELRFV